MASGANVQARARPFHDLVASDRHNQCVDAFRKRRATVDIELEAMADDAPGVDEASIAEQRRKAVHAGIAELPERQRSALVLCQIQGRSNREAAQILDISVDALESLIARARRALKARLADQLELEECGDKRRIWRVPGPIRFGSRTLAGRATRGRP